MWQLTTLFEKQENIEPILAILKVNLILLYFRTGLYKLILENC